MTNYEILSCIIASIAMAITGIAAFFTYRNLREIRKQFFEQNRGNLVFYIRKGQQDKITGVHSDTLLQFLAECSLRTKMETGNLCRIRQKLRNKRRISL